jgi:hypothetical protein
LGVPAHPGKTQAGHGLWWCQWAPGADRQRSSRCAKAITALLRSGTALAFFLGMPRRRQGLALAAPLPAHQGRPPPGLAHRCPSRGLAQGRRRYRR